MKIYVVGGDLNYANWISDKEFVQTPEEADLVLFTGGEDVHPSLYGSEMSEFCYTNLKRDLEEKKIFDSLKPEQYCLGICRGSQFLCIMNGGKLVKDCTGHGLWGTHGITDGNLLLEITSTHHQMQDPYNLNKDNYNIMFYAAPSRSGRYLGAKEHSHLLHAKEPEIVEYHTPNKPKCLAIQGHPEMMEGTKTANFLDNLLKRFINND